MDTGLKITFNESVNNLNVKFTKTNSSSLFKPDYHEKAENTTGLNIELNSSFKTEINEVKESMDSSYNPESNDTEEFYDEIIYYVGGGVDGYDE